MPYRVVDLFCGAGGIGLGFEQCGFTVVAATDIDRACCATHQRNFPQARVFEGDITLPEVMGDLLDHLAGGVEVVVGGPPCQGFSQLGRQLADDPRNQLWRRYMDVVAATRPLLFLMENVPPLLKSAEWEAIRGIAEGLGYVLDARVVNSADYGVPQRRNRAAIVGSRIGPPPYPEPTHYDPSLGGPPLTNPYAKPWRTVLNAISDLPEEPTETDWHLGRNPTERSLARYRAIPPGGNRFDIPVDLLPACWRRKKTGTTDVMGRLQWERPALTIRTEFFKPEKGCYLHPRAHRPITHREAMRLQTFPDDFVFEGSKIEVARQVGNAVPPRLASAFARAFGAALAAHYSAQTPRPVEAVGVAK